MDKEILLSFLLATFLGGFIGWITNWLAIKALFHPRKPIKLIFFDFQGLLPKRQPELAESLGKVIEGKLVKIEELVKQVDPSDFEPVIDEMLAKNSAEIEEKLKEYIASISGKIPFIKFSADSLIKSVVTRLNEEISATVKRHLPLTLEKAANTIAEKVSIHQIVKEKIETMELDKLEELFYEISESEMTLIIRLGGVIGVFVGIIQWLIQNFVIA